MKYYLATITSPHGLLETHTVLIYAYNEEDAQERAYRYYHPDHDISVNIHTTIV